MTRVSRFLCGEQFRRVEKDDVRNEVDLRGLSQKEIQPHRFW